MKPPKPEGASDASDASKLRRRAEASMTKSPRKGTTGAAGPKAAVDAQRLLHELQVHQIELEMQNAELQESRERAETLLDKYTDLYDFAPIGYFSLDDKGRILQVNLTGAALLGMERARLVAQSLSRFVETPSRPAFREFLRQVLGDTGMHTCEAGFATKDGKAFWASLQGCADVSTPGQRTHWRLALSDISSIKQAQEAQRHVEVLSVANTELELEIVRRQSVEETLRLSEQHQRQLLETSRRLQEQLRTLSHQTLRTREDERKRISRELHDVITQTLVGIEFRLESLAQNETVDQRVLRKNIAAARRLLEKAAKTIHDFAQALRPTSLDDLGLIVTLRACLGDFMKRTGIRAQLAVFAGADKLGGDHRTAIYRIAQAALANVAEHSHASSVTVTLRSVADGVHLAISDDGESFDLERAYRAKRDRPLGLIGMRERAEMLGGRLQVESSPGNGTTVSAQFPLRDGKKARAKPKRAQPKE